MMPVDAIETFCVVRDVITECPEEANIINLYEAGILQVVRENDKRPAKLTMYISDDVAKNIKGRDSLRDLYVVMRVPRETVDRITSPIIQQPTIVAP